MEAALKLVGESHAPRRLDIACGINPAKGYTGIDLEPSADIVHDLFQFPWPIRDGCVSKARIWHFVEHIPHYRPEWGARDGWFLFWEEVHRITRKGASIEVLHPFGMSDRAFWDPTHTRFIVPQTWFYLDSRWREQNDLGHYTTADFEVQVAYAGIADDMAGRNDAYIEFHRNHSWNVVPDLSVTLKRR
jgi:hypothetical protein